MLNTREIAILVWGSILLVYGLRRKEVRSSLRLVLKSLLKLAVHPFFMIIYGYIAFMFCMLFETKFLDWEMVKDYFMWIVFGLLPMIFKVATKYKDTTIRMMVLDVFKFSIIPSFIINEYTMSLWIELLLVPIITLLTCVTVIADTDKKYASVKKLTNGIMSILGLMVLCSSFGTFFTKFSDVEKVSFWEKMLFEIIGVILHFPLLYFLKMFNLYEQIIIRTNLVHNKREKIIAAMCIFKYCRMSNGKLLSVLGNVRLNRMIDDIVKLQLLLRSHVTDGHGVQG